MRNLDSVVFIENLPKLDLHGLDKDSAALAIKDYINDKIAEKKDVFKIIHGNGQGILRKVTSEVLSKHKSVLEFKAFYYNTGCTLVKIKI